MVRAAMQMNIKTLLSKRMDVLYYYYYYYHLVVVTNGTTGGTHRYFNTFFSELLPIHWRICFACFELACCTSPELL